MLKNSENPGSAVAQGPRIPGGVVLVFQLPSMGGARIFTGTALSIELLSKRFQNDLDVFPGNQ